MIYTSSHNNDFQSNNNYRTVAISGNRGRDAGYIGECYPALAPKHEFWDKWHNNIGKICEYENNKYYIEEYYKQVLSKLDIEKVYEDLDNSVLLCYEDNMEFCHRHIVSAWFELVLGRSVPEIASYEDNIMIVERPEYIKDYLKEIIIENTDMKGFRNLNARYLYEKGMKLQEQADFHKKQALLIENSYVKRLYRKK